MKNIRIDESRTLRPAVVAATVSVVTKDRLEINTLDGRDSVDSAGLAAGALQLIVDDVLVP